MIKKRVLYALFYCETHQSIGPREMMGFANKNAPKGAFLLALPILRSWEPYRFLTALIVSPTDSCNVSSRARTMPSAWR